MLLKFQNCTGLWNSHRSWQYISISKEPSLVQRKSKVSIIMEISILKYSRTWIFEMHWQAKGNRGWRVLSIFSVWGQGPSWALFYQFKSIQCSVTLNITFLFCDLNWGLTGPFFINLNLSKHVLALIGTLYVIICYYRSAQRHSITTVALNRNNIINSSQGTLLKKIIHILKGGPCPCLIGVSGSKDVIFFFDWL